MASIAKRPDGQWRARYRDEAGREHSKHFARKVDAQRWLDETTAAVVTGNYVDPKAGKVTFATYYKGWSVRQVWAPGTVKAMNLATGSVTFGELPLKSLRRSHLESWVKKMTTKGLAAGTIKTRFNNVRAVLRAAVRDRVIARDPSEGVTLPRVRRADASMAIPSSETVASILRAADDAWRPFFTVAALAGLRLGEVAALQVGDVDFLRRTLRVERQVQRAGGGSVEIRPPKYGSERTVFIPDALVKVLAAHVAARCPGDDPGPLDVQRGRGRTGPSEHRGSGLAPGGCRWRHPAHAPALLRVRADRAGLRCRHRAAGTGPREGDHDAVDLRALVAHSRGPDP